MPVRIATAGRDPNLGVFFFHSSVERRVAEARFGRLRDSKVGAASASERFRQHQVASSMDDVRLLLTVLLTCCWFRVLAWQNKDVQLTSYQRQRR